MRCPRMAPAGARRGKKRVACVHACHGVEERRSWVGAVVSSGVARRDVTCGRGREGDIVKRREHAGEGCRMVITAASAAYLNHAVERTA